MVKIPRALHSGAPHNHIGVLGHKTLDITKAAKVHVTRHPALTSTWSRRPAEHKTEFQGLYSARTVTATKRGGGKVHTIEMVSALPSPLLRCMSQL